MTEKNWEAQWKKIKSLGKGGQGTTWLLEDKQNSQKAVLKLLNKNIDNKARRRMVNEVNNLKTLSEMGGNIPKIIDDNLEFFKDKNVILYFIMQLIEGETLQAYIKKRKKIKIEQA